MKLKLAILAVAFLSACTAPITEVPLRHGAGLALPPMKKFTAPRVVAPARSNAAIAEDFLNLSFMMESGRAIPYLTRFEGPVQVHVAPGAPSSLHSDLGALLSRLRREAGIDIDRTQNRDEAQIIIEALPHKELQRLVPQAACFVVPRLNSWAEYKRTRRSSTIDWTTLKTREKAAIFLPSDVSPQEIRDCLHEELAQALGPLNDLYSLPDSIFNDDNFHTVLTGFDMLILRAYYAPELQNGMTRSQAAQRLPALLARLNPGGAGRGTGPSSPTPRAWIDQIEVALGPNTTSSRRKAAATNAVALASKAGWRDNRMAFSLFAQGRLSLSTDPELALSSFLEAGRLYGARPGMEIQKAHVAMHLAAFSLSVGQFDSALAVINANLSPVAASENAALLATMLMIKSEALEQLGRTSEARAVRLDSLGWARYGFGSDAEVRARLNEIAALSPRRVVQ